MGQKVNPHGFRVGVIKNWDSRWFANDKVFGDTLVEDYNLRKYLKKALFTAGIAKIEIERDGASYHATIDELITYLGLEEFAEAMQEILG